MGNLNEASDPWAMYSGEVQVVPTADKTVSPLMPLPNPNLDSRRFILDELSQEQREDLVRQLLDSNDAVLTLPHKKARFPYLLATFTAMSTGLAVTTVMAPDYADSHSAPTQDTIGHEFCTTTEGTTFEDGALHKYSAGSFRICFKDMLESSKVTVFDAPDADAEKIATSFRNIETGENIPVKDLEKSMGDKFESDVTQIEATLNKAHQANYIPLGTVQLVLDGNDGVDPVFSNMPYIYSVKDNHVEISPTP